MTEPTPAEDLESLGMEMFGKELLVHVRAGDAPTIRLESNNVLRYEITVDRSKRRPTVIEPPGTSQQEHGEILAVGEHEWKVHVRDDKPKSITVNDFEPTESLPFERSTSGRDWLLKIGTDKGPAAIRLVWDSPPSDSFLGIPSYTGFRG